jgi:Ras-related protein Rab-2A
MLVFDINVRTTFQSVESWLAEIRENSQPHINIVLVANKTDLGKSQVTE